MNPQKKKKDFGRQRPMLILVLAVLQGLLAFKLIAFAMFGLFASVTGSPELLCMRQEFIEPLTAVAGFWLGMTAIGLAVGAQWGWYLGSCIYLFYTLIAVRILLVLNQFLPASNLLTATVLLDHADELQATYIARAIISFLVFVYFFHGSVRKYYGLFETKMNAFVLLQIASCVAFSIVVYLPDPLDPHAPTEEPVYEESTLGVDFLMGEENFLEAERKLKAKLALDRKNTAALLKLGEVYLGMNDIDQAASAFRETLRLKPSAYEAHIGLGKIDVQQADFPAAIQKFQRALEMEPTADEALLAWAEAEYLRHDLDAALLHAKKALTINDRRSGTHALMARIYHEQDKTDLRGDAVTKAELFGYPKLEDLRIELGIKKTENAVAKPRSFRWSYVERLYQNGRHAKAIEELAYYLKENPENARALSMRGRCQLALLDFQSASASLKQAILQDAGQVEAIVGLGMLNEIMLNKPIAAKFYEQAIAVDSRSMEAHLRRGEIALSLGQYDVAGDMYKAGVNINDQYAPLLAGRIWAYRMRGWFGFENLDIDVLEKTQWRAPAVEIFRVAHDLRVYNKPISEKQMMGFLVSGDMPGACGMAIRLAEKHPDKKKLAAGVLLLAAVGYFHAGLHRETLTMLDHYRGDVLSHAVGAAAYGLAQLHLGDPASARKNLELAVRLDPSCAQAHYGLAMLYARKNQTASALRHARKAVHSAPKNLNMNAVAALAYHINGDIEKRDKTLALLQAALQDADRVNAAILMMETVEWMPCPTLSQTAIALNAVVGEPKK